MAQAGRCLGRVLQVLAVQAPGARARGGRRRTEDWAPLAPPSDIAGGPLIHHARTGSVLAAMDLPAWGAPTASTWTTAVATAATFSTAATAATAAFVAVVAATATATAVATAATATATATAAWAAFLCLVHPKGATGHLKSLSVVQCLSRRCVIQLHEREPLRSAGVTIGHHSNGHHLAKLRKELAHLCLRG
jgi:hypothetical protein